jgi:hypothetical protein
MSNRAEITLLDGTVLRLGDECRVQQRPHGQWRVAHVVEIAQGTGVDRAFVELRNGVKIGPISRYRLRSHVKTG